MSEATVLSAARDLILSNEGSVAYMYLDTLGNVTIGYGCMLPSAGAAVAVNMKDEKGRTATPDAKSKEWKRVKALAGGGRLNYKAEHYEDDATLFISDAEADRLFAAKMSDFLRSLRIYYKGFQRFPESAQVALIDMIYNMRRASFRAFMHSINVNGVPDWTTAADKCHRSQVSALRNKETRELFLEAAEEAGKAAVRR